MTSRRGLLLDSSVFNLAGRPFHLYLTTVFQHAERRVRDALRRGGYADMARLVERGLERKALAKDDAYLAMIECRRRHCYTTEWVEREVMAGPKPVRLAYLALQSPDKAFWTGLDAGVDPYLAEHMARLWGSRANLRVVKPSEGERRLAVGLLAFSTSLSKLLRKRITYRCTRGGGGFNLNDAEMVAVAHSRGYELATGDYEAALVAVALGVPTRYVYRDSSPISIRLDRLRALAGRTIDYTLNCGSPVEVTVEYGKPGDGFIQRVYSSWLPG